MKLTLVIAIILCSMASTLAQRPAKLGKYNNNNPNTRDIKTVQFTEDYGTKEKFIRIYAACGSSTCYWGKFKIKRDPNLYERIRWRQNHRWLPYYETFTIDQGFVKRTVDILTHVISKDQVLIRIRSDYKDPKRKDRKDDNILKLKAR